MNKDALNRIAYELAHYNPSADTYNGKFIHKIWAKEIKEALAQQRKPLWIDPNDKTQEQFLPNIGNPILFCHGGKTYYGFHNGGSFQCGYGVAKRYYNTWECRWMHLPAAHGIKE